VRITRKGALIVDHLDRTDRRVLAQVGAGIAPDDLARTARTLRLVRSRFETTLEWDPRNEDP
ncbi:MAG TPA: hypothetical protein VLT33_27860, partial [Labilithrix sp.]|nr:hypothetical protein [Labilithrix sp.]